MLKTQDIGNKSYEHEVAGADLFVHYYPYLEAWSFEPILFYDPLTKKNVRADRGMKLGGKTFFFEVDRDTENLSVIEKKIENYITYSRETNERFHVIFDVVVDDFDDRQKRFRKIGEYLETIHRGNQFALTYHTLITNSELDEQVIFTPSGQYSLAEL